MGYLSNRQQILLGIVFTKTNADVHPHSPFHLMFQTCDQSNTYLHNSVSNSSINYYQWNTDKIFSLANNKATHCCQTAVRKWAFRWYGPCTAELGSRTHFEAYNSYLAVYLKLLEDEHLSVSQRLCPYWNWAWHWHLRFNAIVHQCYSNNFK